MKELTFTIDDLMKKDVWQLAMLYQFMFDDVVPVYEEKDVTDLKMAIIQSVISGVQIKIDADPDKIY